MLEDLHVCTGGQSQWNYSFTRHKTREMAVIYMVFWRTFTDHQDVVSCDRYFRDTNPSLVSLDQYLSPIKRDLDSSLFSLPLCINFFHFLHFPLVAVTIYYFGLRYPEREAGRNGVISCPAESPLIGKLILVRIIRCDEMNSKQILV